MSRAATAARGISYLTMIATTPPQGAEPPFVSQGPIYFGQFVDRFVRENDEWKFLERRGSIQMKFSGRLEQGNERRFLRVGGAGTGRGAGARGGVADTAVRVAEARTDAWDVPSG